MLNNKKLKSENENESENFVYLWNANFLALSGMKTEKWEKLCLGAQKKWEWKMDLYSGERES